MADTSLKEEKMDDKKPKEGAQEAVKEAQEVEKVKVGEKEYSQEELSSVVGLGEKARDFETKWNRPIDQLYPDYTQKSQKLSDYEKREKEAEEAKLKEKVEAKEELSPEEARKVVLAEADILGLVHQGNVNQFINSFLQARDLLDDTDAIVSQTQEEGKPKTTTQELLAYMEETGIKSPELAYKSKFEKELDEWKEKQLSKVKGNSMQTLDTSNAGSKQPEQKQPKNWDELRDTMRSYLQNRQQV